jgi:hypothetical protein
MYVDPTRPVNSARFVFLDPLATSFYFDWDSAATDVVAALRSEAGRNPYDRSLADLVGELSTRSEGFRTRWAAHNVRFHRTGVKHLHHPLVGDLHLEFERMDLPADPGLTVFINTAEPGSKSEEALNLLASWTATPAMRRPTRQNKPDPVLKAKTDAEPGRQGHRGRGVGGRRSPRARHDVEPAGDPACSPAR